MARAHTLLETVVSVHQMTEVFSRFLKLELNLKVLSTKWVGCIRSWGATLSPGLE